MASGQAVKPNTRVVDCIKSGQVRNIETLFFISVIAVVGYAIDHWNLWHNKLILRDDNWLDYPWFHSSLADPLDNVDATSLPLFKSKFIILKPFFKNYYTFYIALSKLLMLYVGSVNKYWNLRGFF